MLGFNHLRIRNLLGCRFCLCCTTGVVETVTHLSIPDLQTGKMEYKKGSVLTILWILSVPDGCPRARKEMLGLVRPLLSSDLEVHMQMAPLTMCPSPCEMRAGQSECLAPSRSTLANQALGQCGVMLSITSPPTYAKSISQK